MSKSFSIHLILDCSKIQKMFHYIETIFGLRFFSTMVHNASQAVVAKAAPVMRKLALALFRLTACYVPPCVLGFHRVLR